MFRCVLRDGLTARYKLMADVNITEKRIPQDGRIRFVYGRKEIDLRLSSLPTNHGESIVMRVLESADSRPGFDTLGLNPQACEAFTQVLEQPFGMVVVTGPTGSGKTTNGFTRPWLKLMRWNVAYSHSKIRLSMPCLLYARPRCATTLA